MDVAAQLSLHFLKVETVLPGETRKKNIDYLRYHSTDFDQVLTRMIALAAATYLLKQMTLKM